VGRNLGSQKMQEISRRVEELLPSDDGLCSVELVSYVAL
jgi:hypothetical protein